MLVWLVYDNFLVNGLFIKYFFVYLFEIEVIFVMCMIVSVGVLGYWRFFVFYFVDLWGNGF